MEACAETKLYFIELQIVAHKSRIRSKTAFPLNSRDFAPFNESGLRAETYRGSYCCFRKLGVPRFSDTLDSIISGFKGKFIFNAKK